MSRITTFIFIFGGLKSFVEAYRFENTNTMMVCALWFLGAIVFSIHSGANRIIEAINNQNNHHAQNEDLEAK